MSQISKLKFDLSLEFALKEHLYNVFFVADVVIVVAVIILLGLFSLQHYGPSKVGWLFAPVVLLWFLSIGGIGILNIWKYDSSVLRAFSPIYIFRYFKRRGKNGWTSLGGIMLSITGHLSLHIFMYIYMFYLSNELDLCVYGSHSLLKLY